MEKITNEERARQMKMAGDYQKTISAAWEAVKNKLSEDEKNFIQASSGDKIMDQLMDYLKTKGNKPSEFILKHCQWLFEKGCIPKRNKEALLYSLDHCVGQCYLRGWGRRSFRSADYSYYRSVFKEMIIGFASQYAIDADFVDILENKLPEEQIAFIRSNNYAASNYVYNKYILVYEIDNGSERVINYMKNALESGSSTEINYNLLQAVFMCKNTELYEDVCRLLLAARLQEGLRQAVCESCDCGRIEPFLKIVNTINDNDLIRYSSVKRAVGCWLGLLTPESKDLDRISNKSLDIIVKCLTDENYAKQCLESEDSMKLFISLWSMAAREFHDCVEFMNQVIETGTAHQAMVGGMFMGNDMDQRVKQRLAVKAVLLRHKELNVTAVYLPKVSTTNSFYDYQAHQQRITDMSLRFDSREQAEELYHVLTEMLSEIPKDSIRFAPCVFPWNEERISKSDIVKVLCVIASDLQDEEKIDAVCPMIPLIKSDGYYSNGRQTQVKMLLSEPKSEIQLDTLVSLAGDRETSTRKTVFQLLGKCKLEKKHYAILTDMLRYKSADIRSNIIELLFQQEEADLLETVTNLISDKKEEKRTAGLDMLIQISESDREEEHKESFTKQIALIKTPTSKEKILIERIEKAMGRGEGEKEEEGCGLYQDSDDYQPVVHFDFINSCKEEFKALFPNTLLFGNQPAGKTAKHLKGKKQDRSISEIITALDKLIEEHKNDEYTDAVGEQSLLGNTAGYRTFRVKTEDGKEEIAFKAMWDQFYEENALDGITVFRMSMFLYDLTDSASKLMEKFFGTDLTARISMMHQQIIWKVVHYYLDIHFDPAEVLKAAVAFGYYIGFEAKKEEIYDYVPAIYQSGNILLYIDGEMMEAASMQGKRAINVTQFAKVNELLTILCGKLATANENFADIFAIRYTLGKRFGFFYVKDKERENSGFVSNNYRSNYNGRGIIYDPFSTDSLIMAAYKGVISEGFLYKMLINYWLTPSVGNLSLLVAYKKSGETSARSRSRYWGGRSCEDFINEFFETKGYEKLENHTFTDEENKRIDYAAKVGKKLLKVVLKTEMTRGDSETPFSRSVSSIKQIFGVENFVTLLSAMGKDTLDRTTYFYSRNGVSKRQSLSYLLGICLPDADDNAQKLKELLAATDVTETRLVEAALFSPSWLDIMEEYLGWKGFKSACYYFIAHTNETMDQKMQARIAKYTPISPEDLNAGAFDIDWFREALGAVGEKHFEVIYKAAKYISDGAKHSRARKYADAVMGKMDREKVEKEITGKRNKDTLMAYALIPLSEKDSEKDMAGRYLFIQKFKEESKKFGAQRRASEGRAVECAMQNLAKNAGFADVSRLTLRMETILFENVRPLLEWNEIDEIRLKIEINEQGGTKILCEKGGKTLKSIPSKYKKNEKVMEFTATKKQLTEQYRRTRQMFEEAMENRTEFTSEELKLLSSNPVLAPIVSTLVYTCNDKLGFLRKNKLVDYEGKETRLNKKSRLVIAHCFDLYRDGHWHEYQKYLFDNSIAQPFKQVFRELYVKTEEEAQAFRSIRYAGNQIQPRKAAACLKTRRWVADVEEGLQKIYYKENIIATIYALADWFSPSDIEAPTLEWVEFYDRKTYQAIRIEDIPNVIFSEVMRDVDLAVSVAHAGDVDPETSHSTVEMRKAIVAFTLPLFRLTNVKLEGTHAFINGERADYSIHLGSGVVHLQGGPMINILPVHSQHRGKLFLPFVDDDPKTSQILSEILLFAEDQKIKDPFILDQIK